MATHTQCRQYFLTKNELQAAITAIIIDIMPKLTLVMQYISKEFPITCDLNVIVIKFSAMTASLLAKGKTSLHLWSSLLMI
jgi:hypothetical protein